MWQNIVELLSDYKALIIKSAFAIFFLFLFVHYNTYGKRSSAHYLHLQIRNGQIAEICIAPTDKIFTDRKGVFAVAGKEKVYIPAEWANLTPNENLNLAITFDKNVVDKIYEIDDINAELILNDGRKEGCRGFITIRNKIVR